VFGQAAVTHLVLVAGKGSSATDEARDLPPDAPRLGQPPRVTRAARGAVKASFQAG